MKFSHGGAIGDIIYHIPIIRELGGGDFYIHPASRDFYRTKEDMQYVTLKPLLDLQPYLTKVEWSDHPQGVNFDGWRKVLDFSKNLTNQGCQWLGMADIPDTCPPWLEVGDPIAVAPVTLSRSTRNNFPGFPWRQIVEKYSKHAVFLGLLGEYTAFVNEYGYVPYYPTTDLLQLAKVVKGGKFHIGNPSAPLAVAEGLKHKLAASSFPSISHCVYYGRPGIQHCWDQFEFWEV